jgi:hypothetical protein
MRIPSDVVLHLAPLFTGSSPLPSLKSMATAMIVDDAVDGIRRRTAVATPCSQDRRSQHKWMEMLAAALRIT